jgi:hypothetical protein
MSGDIMFWPQFTFPASVIALMLALGPAALAQSAPPANTLLAEVSAEAGIPYLPAPKAATVALSETFDATESRLCVRAGLGLTVPMMAGPPMTVEHGLFGCPTNTGGLPVVVLQDPALQAPPTSRTGEYNLDVTVRYRLLQLRHMQVIASASDQGVGYSLDSPVSGNNLMLSMSLIF